MIQRGQRWTEWSKVAIEQKGHKVLKSLFRNKQSEEVLSPLTYQKKNISKKSSITGCLVCISEGNQHSHTLGAGHTMAAALVMELPDNATQQ